MPESSLGSVPDSVLFSIMNSTRFLRFPNCEGIVPETWLVLGEIFERQNKLDMAISCIKNSGFYEFFSFISTGGGAFLELIEGKNLPGIEILNN